MEIETIALTDLKVWKDNPRGIEKGDFENLKKRLTEKGQFKPLLVDQENTVLGGNMRLRAMRDLGWKDAQVVRVAPKNAAERLWYALVDNEKSGYYEDEKLAELTIDLPELDDIKIDLGKSIELGDLKDRFRPVEEDEVPEVEGEPESKLGEVYELGRHRLMCGDSTKKEDVEKLMGGKSANLVLTDPPYGLGVEGWDVEIDIEKYLEVTNSVFDSGFFVFTIQMPAMLEWLKKIEGVGWDYKEHVVWIKRTQSGAMEISRCHESILIYKKGIVDYFTTKGLYTDVKLPLFLDGLATIGSINRHIASLWQEIRTGKEGRIKGDTAGHPAYKRYHTGNRRSPEYVNFTNVWSFLPAHLRERKDTAKEKHSTEKPIDLIGRAIQLCSDGDALIYDSFGGSGSTLIACEQLDRTCYMMELDEKYCDVIRKRYANYKEKGIKEKT